MSLTKKLAFTAAASALLVAASTSAFAAGASRNVDQWGGAYVGVGVSHTNMKTHVRINDTFAGQNFEDLNGYSGASFVGADLFAGYGFLFKKAYMGAEAFYRYIPSKDGRITNNDADQFNFGGLSPRHTVGLLARVGYIVLPHVMVYGLVGVVNTKFYYSTTDINNDNHNLSATMTGFMPGLGVQLMLNSRFSLDARYTYTNYTEEHKNFDVGGDNDHVWLEPAANTVSLNAAYHFA